MVPPQGAHAQTPALRTVSRSDAVSQSLKVNLYPGRATAIDFSQTDEVISSILLADQSKITYTTDYPIESHQSQTLFLRRIEPLEFPGATEAYITNLWVKTRSLSGTERLYAFDLVPALASGEGVGIDYGVQILPDEKIAASDVASSHSALNPDVLIVSKNRQVSILDIERGLNVAIARGYTPADDPIVYQVESFLVQVRNTSLTLQEAAQQTGLSLLVLTKLGELGLNEPLATEKPFSASDSLNARENESGEIQPIPLSIEHFLLD
ncbi:hypothetical protein [Coleofasciculus sp. LEGE 07081]|nr:hypothetical protein [Coleofasciculus sp. LEGE 07081]